MTKEEAVELITGKLVNSWLTTVYANLETDAGIQETLNFCSYKTLFIIVKELMEHAAKELVEGDLKQEIEWVILEYNRSKFYKSESKE